MKAYLVTTGLLFGRTGVSAMCGKSSTNGLGSCTIRSDLLEAALGCGRRFVSLGVAPVTFTRWA